EESERNTGVILWSGRSAPGLAAAIRGSFQLLIVPRKMPATIGPVSRRWAGAPSTLYGTVVADSAHGIWTQSAHPFAWSGVIGASEAPKSTVRPVIASIPPPDPIGPYVTVTAVFSL